MALGDQYPEIRIEVDQRLPLETAVVGEKVDDATVSTEITHFDRVGDTYILEGILSFSGTVMSAARGGDAEQDTVIPVDYQLPFALRIPTVGQPDYLDVKTRMRDWKMEVMAPNYVQVQAELTVAGLDARNGYSFYCGDQEDWVLPKPLDQEPDDAAQAEPQSAEAIETSVRHGEWNDQEPGYDEQDWMMERNDLTDEQDTLVFEPGTAWKEQLDSALEQTVSPENGEDVRADEEAREEAFEFEALADEVAPQSQAAVPQQNMEPASMAFQVEEPDTKPVAAAQPTTKKELDSAVTSFSAAKETSIDWTGNKPAGTSKFPWKRDEVESAETTATGTMADVAEAAKKMVSADSEQESAITAISDTEIEVEAIDADMEEKTVASATEVEPAAEEKVTAVNDQKPFVKNTVTMQETTEAEEWVAAQETLKDGPKVSFGSAKEDSSTIKLSGLLTGSVTKNNRSEQPQNQVHSHEMAAGTTDTPASSQATVAEEATMTATDSSPTNELTVEAVTEFEESFTGPKHEPEMAENPVAANDSSLWGNWLKTDSEQGYTLKFRIVQEHESLEQVATRFEIPVENLMRANGMTNEQVDPGQVLFIPGRRR